jgi:hypothetical protein
MNRAYAPYPCGITPWPDEVDDEQKRTRERDEAKEWKTTRCDRCHVDFCYRSKKDQRTFIEVGQSRQIAMTRNNGGIVRV